MELFFDCHRDIVPERVAKRGDLFPYQVHMPHPEQVEGAACHNSTNFFTSAA